MKSKNYADFGQIGKISVQLDDEYYKNGENAKIRKIYDNFHYNLDWRAKIIINFSHLCIFLIFALFMFKLNANFPPPTTEIFIFFRFYF